MPKPGRDLLRNDFKFFHKFLGKLDVKKRVLCIVRRVESVVQLGHSVELEKKKEVRISFLIRFSCRKGKGTVSVGFFDELRNHIKIVQCRLYYYIVLLRTLMIHWHRLTQRKYNRQHFH